MLPRVLLPSSHVVAASAVSLLSAQRSQVEALVVAASAVLSDPCARPPAPPSTSPS